MRVCVCVCVYVCVCVCVGGEIIIGPAMDSSAGEHGMARLGLFLVVMLGLMWRFCDACPASCTCSISRIVCIDSVPGIEDFPVLTLDDMENITEM